MDKKIKILIVDDNQMQNQGLARLLNEFNDLNVRGILSTPDECLKRLEHVYVSRRWWNS